MNTESFFDYLKTTLEGDLKALATINRFLENAPPGSVTIEAVNSFLDCRHIIYENGEKVQRKYIKKEDRELVNKLVKKSYYLDLKDKLEKEISVLSACYNDYVPEEKYRLFDKLSPERKLFTLPFYETVEERVKAWQDQPYIPNTSHPENLIVLTKKKELRRSKSERDISDELDKYEDILAYRYEPQIYLPMSRKCLHPDFVIINKITGRIYYWEHFGGFGKEDYDTDYVYKMQCYTMESPEFRESLITTYETKNYPLQTDMIEAIVRRIIESR